MYNVMVLKAQGEDKMNNNENKNELVVWGESLAALAENDAAHEVVTTTYPFITIKGGVIRVGDTQMPGNKMAVIIASNMFENVYYDTPYTPDGGVSPVCYAFGRTQQEMAPADAVDTPQDESCETCPMNKFGSAATGRGKACGNRRKLICVPAGEYNKKTDEWIIDTAPETLSSYTPGILSLPPTSLSSFAQYVKQVARDYKRPVNAVVTEIRVVPDEKSQFLVKFNTLDVIDKDTYDYIIAGDDDYYTVLTRPYKKQEVAENAQTPKSSKIHKNKII